MLVVPGSTGVTIEPLGSIGGVQLNKVRVAPGGQIPLHSHECNSGMGITQGSARTLGKDENKPVRPGDYIYKPSGTLHGFTDIGAEGFEFISMSDGDGIVLNTGWDIAYA